MPQDPVSHWRLFMRGWGWMSFFPLLFAVVFGLVAMFEGRKMERLEADGAEARAQIVGKDVEVKTDSDGDTTRTYYLYFRFDHRGGAWEGRDSVSRSFYNGLAVGETTPVRYWRPDPDVNEIEPGSTVTSVWITKIISAITLAAFAAWFWIVWDRSGRAIRVRERGERRRATVTGHFRTNVRVNKRPRWKLEWTDEKGVGGRSFMMPGDRLEAWPEGTEIWIYADPRERLKSVWEGDVGPARGHSAVRR